MIAAKECDDQPKVAVVTHGETRTRPYVKEKRNGFEQWIRKEMNPIL
jgi:hypothetical protein